MTRPAGSLQRRLFAGALVFIAGALIVAGIAIGLVLYRFVRGQIDSRLDTQIVAIAADLARAPAGPLGLARAFDGPPFDRELAGWYWQVQQGPRVLRSGSLAGHDLDVPARAPSEDDRPRPGDGTGPRGEGLILRSLVLPGEPATLVVASAPKAALNGPLAEAGRALALTLGVLGLCLFAGVVAQVRLGLRPLGRLTRDLAAVRAGTLARVPGEQPREVGPLVAEVNGLLDQNDTNLARARAHVANLAHGLKTPLATLAMALDPARDPAGTLAPLVADMDRRIRHHLRRARAAALAGPGRLRADLSAHADGLVAALARLHAGQALAIDNGLAPGLGVACDGQDVDEMLGNLIDNACRWARTRVRIGAESTGLSGRLAVTIEDDGPGLADDCAAEMLQRGRRLDESVPGDGFGLPITQELAELYGGTLVLARSELGGLRAVLTLPV